MVRQEKVSFPSGTVPVAGYLFLPEPRAGADARLPTVILAHGFSGTMDRLAPYAERFAASGIAALVFDYRSFGESDRTYGARRVRQDLRHWGHRCGIHRVERLMRRDQLVARRRRRRMPFDNGPRPEHSIAVSTRVSSSRRCSMIERYTSTPVSRSVWATPRS